MAMEINPDLTRVPLSALKSPTLKELSKGLNLPKVIQSPEGLPRDWRGLAHLFDLSVIETNKLETESDKIFSLVRDYGEGKCIDDLKTYLGRIDRYDVLDDVVDMLEKDCIDFRERTKNFKLTDGPYNSLEADKTNLTIHDVERMRLGLDPQRYDAYVLYAEEDSNFANEIIHTMEEKYGFQFCVGNRDLIGGVQFEHDAISKLIATRCNRLLVIVSSNFLKSPANKFLVTFAQAIGIDTRERKVIPILYEYCEVPPELKYYFSLDYNRAKDFGNFWEKLKVSIEAPSVPANSSFVADKKSTSNSSGNWISKPLLEVEHKEISKSTSDLPETKTRNGLKTFNVIKRIKKTYSKNKTISNGESSDSLQIKTTSSLVNLPSLISSDNVPFEQFENSSSFETKDENSKLTLDKKKDVKKKKLWKKKVLEPLLGK